MTKSLPSREAILDLLGKEDRAVHAREIASSLGVEGRGYDALMRQLDDLALQGLLSARDGHRFKLSKASAVSRRGGDEREGYLTVHPRGFGFVASANAAGDDVFVAPEGLAGGMQGDKVVV